MMKKLISLLLMIALLGCAVACSTQSKEPFSYNQTTTGTLTVTAYKGKNQAVVAIPETYKSFKVTAIGELAFEGTVMMTQVVIPDGITSIGASAFANCQRLSEIDLPAKLQEIGDWAFQNCKGLTSVVIPDSVTKIGQYAFKGCVGLTAVTLPQGVKTIGAGAFSELTGLTAYTGSIDHLEHMPKEKLTSVTLVAGAYDRIEFSTFYGCKELTEITYTGTAAEWQALDKADGWVSILPQKQLTVHCADRDITES